LIVKAPHVPHKSSRILEGLFRELGETFAANQSACPSSSDADNGRQTVLRTQFGDIVQLFYIVTNGGATPPHLGASVKYSLKLYGVRTKLNDILLGYKIHSLLFGVVLIGLFSIFVHLCLN